MELTVDRANFLNVVSLVQSIVDRRNTMPALTNLHLEAMGDELCLRAMDLQIAMEARCPAKVVTPGKTTVSARKLFSILKELPVLPVAFRADQEDWISLSCGNADFKLAGLPADRYPAFPEMDYGDVANAEGAVVREYKPLRIESSTLHSMLKKTVFVASKEEGRAAFSGVYWILTSGTLQLVTTDGHRLAHIRRPMESLEIAEKQTLLLPRRAMAELERIIDTHKDAKSVEMFQNGQQVVFRLNSVVLSCSLLEGRFPNYEMVIPKDNDKSVQVSRDALRQAIRRTSLLADDQFRGIQLALLKDKILLTCRNKELGHAREEIAINFQGPEIEVVFNSSYVLEFLSSLEGEEIELSFKTPTSASLLKDLEDDGYQCILMPMKI